MRKIYIHCSTGYCGMDMHDCIEVEDNTSVKELDEMAWEMAIQNAAMYGLEAHEDDCECEECVENGGSKYRLDQAEGSWEEYNEEKHGGYIR